MEIPKLLKMSKRNNFRVYCTQTGVYLLTQRDSGMISTEKPERKSRGKKNQQSQNLGLSSPETRFYKTSNECCTLFFWIRSMVLFMRTLKRKPMSAYVFICKEAYCVIVKRLQRKQKLSHANYAKWARFMRIRKEKWKKTQSGKKMFRCFFKVFQ